MVVGVGVGIVGVDVGLIEGFGYDGFWFVSGLLGW